MKHFYSLKLAFLLSFIAISHINAQYTAIPDSNFEQHLITQAIDSEGTLDGQVLTSDIAAVSSLDISYSSISNLTGISDFSALTYLRATFVTSLTSLDLSGLIALDELDLSMSFNVNALNITGCSSLRDLDIRFTQISTLDLSTSPTIEIIDMYKNTGIQNLDLSGLTSLTRIAANESVLQVLNVAGCSALSTIQIDETSVTSLDLSNNLALTNLTIYDTFIDSIYLTNCTNFQNLSLIQCRDLAVVDLTNCTSMTNLNILDTYSDLTSLDFSTLTALESIDLSGSGIEDVDLSNNTNLTSLSISGSGVNTLDLRNGHNVFITSFYIYDTGLQCVNVDDDVYSTLNWTNISPTIFFKKDCSILSVDENNRPEIRLFPNPSDSNISISGLEQEHRYQIYNVLGEALISGDITFKSQINIRSLSKGVYFIKLDTYETIRFVKK